MIYIKIYVDKDDNGEDMLVFDSAKYDNDSDMFTVAGKKSSPLSKYYYFKKMTSVIGVEQVTISPEAKALFLALLSDESACKELPYGQNGDFTMCGCYHSNYGWDSSNYGWDSGKFAFQPPKIKQGETKKTLRRGEHFTITCVFSKDPLEYMMPCRNEILKNLDLSEPADETPLLDDYYATMRARGEELGCDTQTIRKTPVRYLTEAQKNVIREDYRRKVSRYDAQEWHDNGEFIRHKIIGELLETYLKVTDDI